MCKYLGLIFFVVSTFFNNLFGAATSPTHGMVHSESFYTLNSDNQSIGDFIEIINTTPLDLFFSVRSGGVILDGRRQNESFLQIAYCDVNANRTLRIPSMENLKFKIFSVRIWISRENCSLDEYYKNFNKQSIAFFLSPMEVTGLRKIFIRIKNSKLNVDFEYDFTASPACAICMNRFKSDESLMILDCGHKFHNDENGCAAFTLLHELCPVCRKPVGKKKIKKTVTSQTMVLSNVSVFLDNSRKFKKIAKKSNKKI